MLDGKVDQVPRTCTAGLRKETKAREISNKDGVKTNRFKGLDLTDRMYEELWMEIPNTVQEAVIKTIPKKKKCKKAKWLSEEALQTAKKRREAKAKKKRKDISI